MKSGLVKMDFNASAMTNNGVVPIFKGGFTNAAINEFDLILTYPVCWGVFSSS
jgi:hypothetical protein